MKKKVIAIIMAIFAIPLALAGGTFLSFANSDTVAGGGFLALNQQRMTQM